MWRASRRRPPGPEGPGKALTHPGIVPAGHRDRSQLKTRTRHRRRFCAGFPRKDDLIASANNGDMSFALGASRSAALQKVGCHDQLPGPLTLLIQ